MGDTVKHVLVASLGLSPAVITETLWAMLNPADGRAAQPVDRVHVLTTARWHPTNHYAEFDGLCDMLKAKLEKLHEEHGRAPPELVFEAVERRGGGEQRFIADVSTQEENILFAGRITRIVWDYAQDPNWVIHMSLAGGRKSMSSYAHTAMMFFGRVQDTLSHVLVEPSELELCGRTFWWPGQEEKALRLVHKGPGSTVEEVEVPTDKARVELVQVPYLRLGVLIPDQVRIQDVDYDELVRFVDFWRGGQPVVFDYRNRTVSFGVPLPGGSPQHPVILETRQFCLLSLFAMARKQDWRVSGKELPGRVALIDFSVGSFRDGHGTKHRAKKPVVDILQALYQGLAPRRNGAFKQPFIDKIREHAMDEGFDNPVQSDLSKIKSQLGRISSPLFRQMVMPNSIVVGASPFWGFDLSPDRIVLLNYPEDILAMGAGLA